MMAFPIKPFDWRLVAAVVVILDIARHEGRICSATDLLARSGNARRYLELANAASDPVWGAQQQALRRRRLCTCGRDPSQISLADIFEAVAPARQTFERERTAGSLVIITADCLDGLARKWDQVEKPRNRNYRRVRSNDALQEGTSRRNCLKRRRCKCKPSSIIEIMPNSRFGRSKVAICAGYKKLWQLWRRDLPR